jgi:hypothetical protein
MPYYIIHLRCACASSVYLLRVLLSMGHAWRAREIDGALLRPWKIRFTLMALAVRTRYEMPAPRSVVRTTVHAAGAAGPCTCCRRSNLKPVSKKSARERIQTCRARLPRRIQTCSSGLRRKHARRRQGKDKGQRHKTPRPHGSLLPKCARSVVGSRPLYSQCTLHTTSSLRAYVRVWPHVYDVCSNVFVRQVAVYPRRKHSSTLSITNTWRVKIYRHIFQFTVARPSSSHPPMPAHALVTVLFRRTAECRREGFFFILFSVSCSRWLHFEAKINSYGSILVMAVHLTPA